MKSVISFTVAVLAISSMGLAKAQAKTFCSINQGENSLYDRVLFSGEVVSPQTFLVGENLAEPVQLSQINTMEKWKAINGKSIVTIVVEQDGVHAMSVAHVDLKQKHNVLPTDAMALGGIEEGRFLSLIAPGRGLSVNCSTKK